MDLWKRPKLAFQHRRWFPFFGWAVLMTLIAAIFLIVEDRIGTWANKQIDIKTPGAITKAELFLDSFWFSVSVYLLIVVIAVILFAVVLFRVTKPIHNNQSIVPSPRSIAAAELEVRDTSRSQPKIFPRSDEIKTESQVSLSATTIRVSVVTPTPGHFVRVFGYTAFTDSDEVVEIQIYYGTGATYDSYPGKQIDAFLLGKPETTHSREFPEDGRPRSDVDEVVSFRTKEEIEKKVRLTVRYKEE